MELIIRLFVAATLLVILYIRSKDRGSHEPTGALWGAAAFGVLAIPIAVILEGFFTQDISLTEPMGVTSFALREGMLIGLIEEAAKFIPLAIFIYKRPYFNEHTDGVLYFAIAGLGFGLPENLLYSLEGGLAVGLTRLVMTPYFHAATTAFIGYFLIRQKLQRGSILPVIFAFALMVTAHGVYDFGLFTGVPQFALLSVGITFALSGGLFWLAHHAMVLDQRMGLAAVGKNLFCRTCGAHNPKKYLYCIYCGKRT